MNDVYVDGDPMIGGTATGSCAPPDAKEGDTAMPAKRKNNGMRPGMRFKTISQIPFSREQMAQLERACDRLDATRGCVMSVAFADWAERRKM